MAHPKKGVLAKTDLLLIFAVLAAVAVGFIAIASATSGFADQKRFFIMQGVAFFAGICVMVFLASVDYDILGQLVPFVLVFNILFLLVTLFIGVGETETGTRGWIRFGMVGIQPAEVVKVGFIIAFAKHIERVRDEIDRPGVLFVLLLHLGVMMGLILLQPDAGTAFVYFAAAMVMIYLAGINIRYILGALGALLAAAPLTWFFLLNALQKERFLVWFDPERDPLRHGYHVIQSKIAIGAGRILGAGLFSGPQTQLGYLPEKQTDFIFAVIGEEAGFVGCMIVLALMAFIICRVFYIAHTARDSYGELLAAGVGAIFLIHTVENIGMCIGLFPVTGIPLPFISYGGSGMLSFLSAVGIVLNVHYRRKRL